MISKWYKMITRSGPKMITQNDPQSRENDLINAELIFESGRVAGRASEAPQNDYPK